MRIDAASARHIEAVSNEAPGRLVTCRLDDLHPHPSYARHQLAVPASELSALEEQGEFAFRERLVITRDQTIIAGYGRFELAKRKGRLTLSCIEYDLSQSDALHWLLQAHQRSKGLNSFSRILLTLDLEPWFKERARLNQQVGGQQKGSSKLTKAERVSVRSELARAAGVSVGNVTKAKQVLADAVPEIVEALRNGELSIHRAWTWRKAEPEDQRDALGRFRFERGLMSDVRQLALRRSPTMAAPPDANDLLTGLNTLSPNELQLVTIAVVKGPGRAIFVTEALAQDIDFEQRRL